MDFVRLDQKVSTKACADRMF